MTHSDEHSTAAGWQDIASAPKDGTRVRGQRIIPPLERIMSFVNTDDATGCWNWTGTVRSDKKPYGRLIMGSRRNGSRKSIGAHQYSYMTFIGPIPTGMCVCHKCDNPRCVNPEHLFLGTKKDNADDRDRKGRNRPAPIQRGEASPSAKLTAVQVGEIRTSKLPSQKIALLYGVSGGHIRALRRGENFCFPPPPEAAQ